ncbi:MAG: hypothetical protein Q4D57_06525 [Clostridia bacterium]|nr:hypothetical protein [Clostridia bacterium]
MKLKNKSIKILSFVLSLSTAHMATNSVCFASGSGMHMPGTDEFAHADSVKKINIESQLLKTLRERGDNESCEKFLHWCHSYTGQSAVKRSVATLKNLNFLDPHLETFRLRKFITDKKLEQDIDAIDLWCTNPSNTGLYSLVQALAYVWININVNENPELAEEITNFSKSFEEYFEIAASYNMLDGYEELPQHLDDAFPDLHSVISKIVRAINVELQLNMMWSLEHREPLDSNRVLRALKNANNWIPICIEEFKKIPSEE